MDNKKEKKLETGGILFALFILLLGAFTLLTETPFTVGLFRLIRLWPLLIIGLGVWLIFKTVEREKIGAVILAVILVGAMYSAFFQPLQQLEFSDEEGIPAGVTSMDVSMELMFGWFRIDSTSEHLYASRGYYYPLESHVSTRGKTADLSLTLQEEAFIPFKDPGNEYEILLYDAFPVSMNADVVFSSCTFDVSALNVEEINLDGALSSFEIIFGETDTSVDLDMGIIRGLLYVPQSVGVKIISEGVVSLSVPSGWIKIDGGYKSPNYDTASHKIDIACDIGMGFIKISYIEIS